MPLKEGWRQSETKGKIGHGLALARSIEPCAYHKGLFIFAQVETHPSIKRTRKNSVEKWR
jgi:hypothetical protein